MSNTPAQFKPPVGQDEFISGITDKPEDQVEDDKIKNLKRPVPTKARF